MDFDTRFLELVVRVVYRIELIVAHERTKRIGRFIWESRQLEITSILPLLRHLSTEALRSVYPRPRSSAYTLVHKSTCLWGKAPTNASLFPILWGSALQAIHPEQFGIEGSNRFDISTNQKNAISTTFLSPTYNPTAPSIQSTTTVAKNCRGPPRSFVDNTRLSIQTDSAKIPAATQGSCSATGQTTWGIWKCHIPIGDKGRSHGRSRSQNFRRRVEQQRRLGRWWCLLR